MTHFDVAVIGTGSGNTFLDERYDGLTVALFEEGTFGGTCLNVGCIPTKMFVYPSDVANAVKSAHRFGVDAHIDGVRWQDMVNRVFGRIDPIADGGRRYREQECDNITVFRSHARFTGPRTIASADGQTITADQVVIATGSRPIIPDAVLDSGVTYYTNENVMRIPELPKRLLVLGTGYIAAEFAHVFSALGSQVSVIGRSGLILRHLDGELSQRFTELAKTKWDCHLDSGVKTVRATDGGVEVELVDGSVVTGDALLVAIGRAPNSDLIDAATAGVEIDDDGLIVVDEYQRTTAEGVFALGDVSSKHQLKHVANHEARVVGHNLIAMRQAEQDGVTPNLRASDHRFVPFAVFTEPQIASVGLTEAQARAKYPNVTVKVQNYGDVAYGWAMEDSDGICKIIADQDTGQLLGAHILGAQASVLIQPLIQAMSFGLRAADMAKGQYWIHPALTEVVENALLGLEL